MITQADQPYEHHEKQDDVGDEYGNNVKLVVFGIENEAKSLNRVPNGAELQMDELKSKSSEDPLFTRAIPDTA
jgi:hypothetical protein